MNEVINIEAGEIQSTDIDIKKLTDALLVEVRKEEILKNNSIVMPLAELSTLGAGVSSLLPAFNAMTFTSSMNVDGLFTLANSSVGDTLKVAKNGNFWGAFNTADGGSKFAQLASADPISSTNTLVMNANPATMMMAVALFSIEKELGNIAEMEKQIISFLEIEKESEIEADVMTLSDIISKYKHNWDNERYVSSNHKMVCDIQRTTLKNMIFYQKQVSEALKSKQLIVMENKVNATLQELLKKFKYYRLTLYTYSLSCLTEVMLSGNFNEDNIKSNIDEIRKNSDEYRDLFMKCSVFLEEQSKGSLELNVIKGIGAVSDMAGHVFGKIPKVKDSGAKEALISKGEDLKNNAIEISRDVVESFSEVSNPNTKSFVIRLEDMNTIYNNTKEICFDKDNLYLIAG